MLREKTNQAQQGRQTEGGSGYRAEQVGETVCTQSGPLGDLCIAFEYQRLGEGRGRLVGFVFLRVTTALLRTSTQSGHLGNAAGIQSRG